MNSWDSTKLAETLYCHCGPRTKMIENGIGEKDMRVDKLILNIIIYIHL